MAAMLLVAGGRPSLNRCLVKAAGLLAERGRFQLVGFGLSPDLNQPQGSASDLNLRGVHENLVVAVISEKRKEHPQEHQAKEDVSQQHGHKAQETSHGTRGRQRSSGRPNYHMHGHALASSNRPGSLNRDLHHVPAANDYAPVPFAKLAPS